MTRYCVFGATGRTGRAFVRRALSAHHEVTAFVRDGGDLPQDTRVIVGDVLDAASVDRAVQADHIVVVTLGGAEAMTTGGANVVHAAVRAGATRLLGVVGAGVLQADATRLRHELPNYPAQLHAIGAAHRAFYDALNESPLEWTLACTPRLLDGPRSEALRVSANYLPEGSGSVTTEDVAAFLLDEAERRAFVRSRVGLNGAPRS